MRRRSWITAIVFLVAAVVAPPPAPSAAQSADHRGDNSVAFEVVGRPPGPGAKGRGEVDYDGGAEPRSRWSASFRFTGLAPNAGYEVVVRGRFGADGSAEAAEYTGLCSFTSEADGAGSCFAYFRGLMRLDVVQLRDAAGRRVMQATRSDDGPGAITTVPNRFTDPATRKAKSGAGGRAARHGESTAAAGRIG